MVITVFGCVSRLLVNFEWNGTTYDKRWMDCDMERGSLTECTDYQSSVNPGLVLEHHPKMPDWADTEECCGSQSSVLVWLILEVTFFVCSGDEMLHCVADQRSHWVLYEEVSREGPGKCILRRRCWWQKKSVQVFKVWFGWNALVVLTKSWTWQDL